MKGGTNNTKHFKILYAGNLGEAQNFEKIIQVAKI